MSEQDSNRPLTSDAEIYLKIGYLLQKPRSSEDQSKVQQILNSDLALFDKLRRIEDIDSEIVSGKKTTSNVNNQEINELLKSRNIPTSETINKNINSLKANFHKSRFFHYLFQELPKIKKYAKKTGMIRASAFQLQLVARKTLISSIQKDASSLQNYLSFVLDSGWMILTKFEFNLVVQFKKLCDEILNFNIYITSNLKDYYEKFQTIEKRFMICHYKVEYTDTILNSMVLVMKTYQKPAEKIEHMSLLVKKVLTPSWEKHCLYNLVVAINIIFSKKYLDLRDLIQDKSGGVINTFQFECSENSRLKIDEYITENERKLKELAVMHTDIIKMQLFLNNFIPKTESSKEGYDFSTLIYFYESGQDVDKFKFHRDKDNLSLFAHNYLLRFFREFETFLIGRTRFENGGEHILFATDLFHMDISKLRGISKKISNMAFANNIFTRSRFVEIKQNPKHHVAQDEMQIIQVIDDLSMLLVDLGKKVGHLSMSVQRNNSPDQDQKDFKPLDSSFLLRTQYNVPFWDKLILYQQMLNRKTMSEALSFISTLCFLAGLFFYNHKLLGLMEKELKISDEIRKIKNQLERIADVVVFDRIKKTYDI